MMPIFLAGLAEEDGGAGVIAAILMALSSPSADSALGELWWMQTEPDSELTRAFERAMELADQEPCDAACVEAQKSLLYIRAIGIKPYEVPCEGTPEQCAAILDTMENVEAVGEDGDAGLSEEYQMTDRKYLRDSTRPVPATPGTAPRTHSSNPTPAPRPSTTPPSQKGD